VKKLCYTRTESFKDVTITYNTKYNYAMYLFLIMMAIGSISKIIALSYIGFGLLILQWVYSLIVWAPVGKKIKKAIKSGNAAVSGNKYSLNNPLVYVIKK